MVELKGLGYEHIICKLGSKELDKNSIRELKIEKRINDHVRFRVTGMVVGDQKEKYVEMAEADTQVTVESIMGGTTTVLFKGLVTHIEVKAVNDTYYFEIEGASYTYKMDLKKRNRSFQDINQEYKQLIEDIAKSYDAICNKVAVKEEKLGQFTLQYQETDWEFLKRMASRSPFNTSLVADATGDKVQFWFGIPEGTEQAGQGLGAHFNIRKKLGAYHDSKENHSAGAGEQDFIYYEIRTDGFYNIGDRVNFKGEKRVVCQSTAMIEGGLFRFDCVLAPASGIKQNPLFNSKITGVSIEGKVIAVERDHVKVSLVGIGEKNQAQDKACLFPYATMYTAEGNTGWYCMPEVDDYIRLYCPTHQEEEAFVTASVRLHEQGQSGQSKSNGQSGDKIDDPKVKYFRTKFGKEIMFGEKEIVITGKDGETLIRLHEDKGIEIFSGQGVTVTAKKDVTINSEEGKVTISAGAEIDLVCKASSIKIDDEVNIKGSQVKIN